MNNRLQRETDKCTKFLFLFSHSWVCKSLISRKKRSYLEISFTEEEKSQVEQFKMNKDKSRELEREIINYHFEIDSRERNGIKFLSCQCLFEGEPHSPQRSEWYNLTLIETGRKLTQKALDRLPWRRVKFGVVVVLTAALSILWVTKGIPIKGSAWFMMFTWIS